MKPEKNLFLTEIQTQRIYNITTYRLKARSAELEETTVATQRFGKHVAAATDTHATIEELLQELFSMRSVSRGRQLRS
jgi:hypothetical protein